MIGSLLTGVAGALFKTLSAPILDRVIGVVEKRIGASVDKDKIRAELETALAEACVDIAEHQTDVLKVALVEGSPAERNWRAVFMAFCGFTLIWYALAVPVLVAWFGFPPPRVGDTLLEWIYMLCAAGVAGYAGGPPAMRFAERIVAAWRRK